MMFSNPIVKECTACGQGFAEDLSEVGGRLTTVTCREGHEGPFPRIASAQAGKNLNDE